MKKNIMLIILLVFFSMLGFSQEYFHQFTNQQEFYYHNERIDLTELKSFCRYNKLIDLYLLKHDTKNEKYYLIVGDKEDRIFYLFSVINGKVNIKELYRIGTPEKSWPISIDNSKVFFASYTEEKQKDYYIYDLIKNELQGFDAKGVNTRDLDPIAYKNNKIFYQKKGYFDIQKNKFFSYPIELDYISVDDDGEKIVGINEKNYIVIVDLITGEQKNTKIKRKMKKYVTNDTEGLLYLRKDVLYFTKRRNDILDPIEALVFVYAKEKRQWYKMDLKTGKKKKIEQPSKIAEMM